jgi:hypothetical protein
MSRRKLGVVLLAAVVAGAVAAGIAVAGKGNGNNTTFEYAIGLWGTCRTPTCRLRPASRT